VCIGPTVQISKKYRDLRKPDHRPLGAAGVGTPLISVAGSARGSSAAATSFLGRPCHLLTGARKGWGRRRVLKRSSISQSTGVPQNGSSCLRDYEGEDSPLFYPNRFRSATVSKILLFFACRVDLRSWLLYQTGLSIQPDSTLYRLNSGAFPVNSGRFVCRMDGSDTVRYQNLRDPEILCLPCAGQ
jgi:hypothetical protein